METAVDMTLVSHALLALYLSSGVWVFHSWGDIYMETSSLHAYVIPGPAKC